MKTFCLLLALFAAFAAPAAAAKEHPIVKVIAMLEGLAAKAEAEGKEEALAYEKFEYWVKTSVKELDAAIATEKEDISELSDLISGKTKEEEVLTEQIEKLTEELQALDAEMKMAAGNRADANGVYVDKSTALKLTIQGCQECLTVLTASKDNTDTGLLQTKVTELIPLVAERASEKEMALLQEVSGRPTQLAKGDKGGHVKGYAFKSGSVVELLKGLEAKFEEELLATEKAETNSLNAFELANAARKDLIDAATESKEAKEKTLGEVKETLATAKGDKEGREQDLADDTATLESTKKDASVKAEEWAARSKTRAGEIEAIKTAVEILSKTTNVRTDAPSNPVPPPSPIADFLQLKAQPSDKKMKAVELLRRTAKVTNSKVLEAFANQVAAHLTGPFDAVNNEIEKMIYRLMDEQKKEDEHKIWCDEELRKSKASEDDKEDKVDELTAKIEAGVAKSAKLVEAIAEADQMVAKIIEHMEEATEIRKVGKEENRLAIKDAEEAQTAVSNAIAVLEEFYKSSGEVPKESWEFIQTKGDVELPDKPSTWGSSYSGVADPDNQPSGILTILEKVSEDFAKMEAETRAQEQEDQDIYDEEMKNLDIEKARRTKEAEMKTQEQKRTDAKVQAMEKTKKGVNKELDAVKQYLEDLKPACVDGDSSYEDRKAARDQEIAGLKQAKMILADAFGKKAGTAFLQKA